MPQFFLNRQRCPFLELIFLRQFFKCLQGIYDAFIGYTVGDSHVARAGERASRYHQNVVLLGRFTELLFILHWRLHEEIEGSLRFHTGKTALCQSLIQGDRSGRKPGWHFTDSSDSGECEGIRTAGTRYF